MIVWWALQLAIGAVTLSLGLCAWRVLRGPSAVDRVLALDTMSLNAVALAVLLGLFWQTTLLFEAALIIALLGFVSTVALARFIHRGDVVE